ncbi:hypothetical protein GCM10027299_42140 [Larkinella ripae]
MVSPLIAEKPKPSETPQPKSVPRQPSNQEPDWYPEVTEFKINPQVATVLRSYHRNVGKMQGDLDSAIQQGGSAKRKALEEIANLSDSLLGSRSNRNWLSGYRVLSKEEVTAPSVTAGQAIRGTITNGVADMIETLPKLTLAQFELQKGLVNKGISLLTGKEPKQGSINLKEWEDVNQAIEKTVEPLRTYVSENYNQPLVSYDEKDGIGFHLNVDSVVGTFSQVLNFLAPAVLTAGVGSVASMGAKAGLKAATTAAARTTSAAKLATIGQRMTMATGATSFLQSYPAYAREAQQAGLNIRDATLLALPTAALVSVIETASVPALAKSLGLSEGITRQAIRQVGKKELTAGLQKLVGTTVTPDLLLETIKGVGKNTAQNLTKKEEIGLMAKLLGGAGRRVGNGFLEQGLTEGGEEAVQSLIENGAKDLYNTFFVQSGQQDARFADVSWQRYVFDSLYGSALGAIVGTGMGTLIQSRQADPTLFGYIAADYRTRAQDGESMEQMLGDEQNPGSLAIFGVLDEARQKGEVTSEQATQLRGKIALMADTARLFDQVEAFTDSDRAAMFDLAQNRQQLGQRAAWVADVRSKVDQMEQALASGSLNPAERLQQQIERQKLLADPLIGGDLAGAEAQVEAQQQALQTLDELTMNSYTRLDLERDTLQGFYLNNRSAYLTQADPEQDPFEPHGRTHDSKLGLDVVFDKNRKIFRQVEPTGGEINVPATLDAGGKYVPAQRSPVRYELSRPVNDLEQYAALNKALGDPGSQTNIGDPTADYYQNARPYALADNGPEAGWLADGQTLLENLTAAAGDKRQTRQLAQAQTLAKAYLRDSSFLASNPTYGEAYADTRSELETLLGVQQTQSTPPPIPQNQTSEVDSATDKADISDSDWQSFVEIGQLDATNELVTLDDIAERITAGQPLTARQQAVRQAYAAAIESRLRAAAQPEIPIETNLQPTQSRYETSTPQPVQSVAATPPAVQPDYADQLDRWHGTNAALQTQNELEATLRAAEQIGEITEGDLGTLQRVVEAAERSDSAIGAVVGEPPAEFAEQSANQSNAAERTATLRQIWPSLNEDAQIEAASLAQQYLDGYEGGNLSVIEKQIYGSISKFKDLKKGWERWADINAFTSTIAKAYAAPKDQSSALRLDQFVSVLQEDIPSLTEQDVVDFMTKFPSGPASAKTYGLSHLRQQFALLTGKELNALSAQNVLAWQGENPKPMPDGAEDIAEFALETAEQLINGLEDADFELLGQWVEEYQTQYGEDWLIRLTQDSENLQPPLPENINRLLRQTVESLIFDGNVALYDNTRQQFAQLAEEPRNDSGVGGNTAIENQPATTPTDGSIQQIIDTEPIVQTLERQAETLENQANLTEKADLAAQLEPVVDEQVAVTEAEIAAEASADPVTADSVAPIDIALADAGLRADVKSQQIEELRSQITEQPDPVIQAAIANNIPAYKFQSVVDAFRSGQITPEQSQQLIEQSTAGQIRTVEQLEATLPGVEPAAYQAIEDAFANGYLTTILTQGSQLASIQAVVNPAEALLAQTQTELSEIQSEIAGLQQQKLAVAEQIVSEAEVEPVQPETSQPVVEENVTTETVTTENEGVAAEEAVAEIVDNSEAVPVTPESADAELSAEQQAEGEETLDRLTDFGQKIGAARKDTAERGYTRAKAEADGQPGWAKKYKVFENKNKTFEVAITKGNQFRTVKRGFTTEAEAYAAIPLIAVSSNHRVYQKSEGNYAIYRVYSNGKTWTVQENFATRDAALQYMAENPQEIITKKSPVVERPHLDNLQRNRPDYRDGKNATPEMLMSTFGFRGGEFGNWLAAEERQIVLNMAYDAFMDLADVLGVPPATLSLGGELSIGFGSRGKGLSAAQAHYEPARAVINLTKVKGAGSLAHEWFHAFDNFFARQDGKAAPARNEQGTFDLTTKDRTYFSHGKSIRSGVRPEVSAAFDTAWKVITSKTVQRQADVNKAEGAFWKTGEALKAAIADLRKPLTSPPSYRKKQSPATAEQLEQFDALTAQLLTGDLGERKWVPRPGSKFKGDYYFDAEKALYNIYKAGTGRSINEYDNVSGPLFRHQKAFAEMQRAEAGIAQTATVKTDFVTNAQKLDQGRASAYWTSPHELMARAFESFVQDKIAEQGESQYLVHSADNLFYALFDQRPYPEGQERIDINAAMEGIFSGLLTKIDDSGNSVLFQLPNDVEGAAAISPVVSTSKSLQADVKSELDSFVASLKIFDSTIPISVNSAEYQHALADSGALRLTNGIRPRGFEWNSRVYLDPTQATGQTALHEVGHVWTNLTERLFPDLFAQGESLIRDTIYFSQLNQQAYYKTLPLRQKVKEAMARAIEDKGARFVTPSRKNAFWSWLQELGRTLAEWAGILPQKDPLDLSIDEWVGQVIQKSRGQNLADVATELTDAQTRGQPQFQLAGPVSSLDTRRATAESRLSAPPPGLTPDLINTPLALWTPADQAFVQQISGETGWKLTGPGQLAWQDPKNLYFLAGGRTVQLDNYQLGQLVSTGFGDAYQADQKGYFNKGRLFQSMTKLMRNWTNLETFIGWLDDQSGTLKELIQGVKTESMRRAAYASITLQPLRNQAEKRLANFSDELSGPGMARTLSVRTWTYDPAGTVIEQEITLPISVAMGAVLSADTLAASGEIPAHVTTGQPIAEQLYTRNADGSLTPRASGSFYEDAQGNRQDLLFDQSQIDQLRQRFETGFGGYAGEPGAYQAIKDFFNNPGINRMLEAENAVLRPNRSLDTAPFFYPVSSSKAGLSGQAGSRTLANSKVFVDRQALDERQQQELRTGIALKDPVRLMGEYASAVDDVLQYGRLVQNLERLATALDLTYTGPEKKQILRYLRRRIDDYQNHKQKRAEAYEDNGFVRSVENWSRRYIQSVFSVNIKLPLLQSGTYVSAYGLGTIRSEFLNKAAGIALKLAKGAYTDLTAQSILNTGEDDYRTKLLGQETNEAPYVRWLQGEHIQDETLRQRHREKFATIIYRISGGQTLHTGDIELRDLGLNGTTLTKAQQGLKYLDGLADQWGTGAMKRSDRGVILAFVEAAKYQADAEGLDANSDAYADRVADLAERTMFATNQMSQLTEQTAMQLSNDFFSKVVGLFSGQSQKLLNTLMQALTTWIKAPGGSPAADEALKRLAFSFGTGVLFNALYVSSLGALGTTLMALLSGDEPKEPDEIVQQIGFDFVRNVVGMAPGMGEMAVNYWLNQHDTIRGNEDMLDVLAFETITEGIDGADAIGGILLAEDDEKRQKAIDSAIYNITSFAAHATGTPSSIWRLGREHLTIDEDDE